MLDFFCTWMLPVLNSDLVFSQGKPLQQNAVFSCVCPCVGYAGVVRFGGLRIGGLSGIFKVRDYARGHFEHPPYNEDTKRSCYHIRNVDVFRLKQVKCLDVLLFSCVLCIHNKTPLVVGLYLIKWDSGW